MPNLLDRLSQAAGFRWDPFGQKQALGNLQAAQNLAAQQDTARVLQNRRQASGFQQNPTSSAVVQNNNLLGGGFGGGGGGAPGPAGEPPLEGTGDAGGYKEESLRIIDEAINRGAQALDQFSSTLQGQLPNTLEAITQGAAQRVGDVTKQGESRLTDFGEQRGREERRTESAVAEARRQAAELMQGIQSRFGGSTSAGGAFSEILGAQATRNIAGNRAALQETVGQIVRAENDVKSQVADLTERINTEAQLQKTAARDALNQQLAEINARKAELTGTQAASLRLQVLEGYQNFVNGINQRNTQFKQQLFLSQQRALEAFQNQKNQVFEAGLNIFDPDVARSLSALNIQGGQGLVDVANTAAQQLLPAGVVGTSTADRPFFQLEPVAGTLDLVTQADQLLGG